MVFMAILLKYYYKCGLFNIVRVLYFGVEGLRFDPWPGHGDFNLGTLHIYVTSSPRYINGHQH